MPKANFVTGWDASVGRPDIPPMQASDSGDQLHYDDAGTLRGGFCCISYVPDITAVIQVEASLAVINAMKADEDNYVWLEDIVEEELP